MEIIPRNDGDTTHDVQRKGDEEGKRARAGVKWREEGREKVPRG